MIKVVAKNILKDGKIEEFKTISATLVSESRKEKACIKYELFQDLNQENIFTFIEEWESPEALNTHMQSSHFKELAPKISALLDKEMEVNVYKLID